MTVSLNEEVDVPGIGQLPKGAVIAMGVAVVGVAGVFWYRHYRTAAAASSTGAPTPDPATGSDTGSDVYGNPDPNGNGSGSVDETGDQITTDSEWVQAVVDDLGNQGRDPSYVTDVLALYLTGQSLNADQAQIVRDAWALRGKPPEHSNLAIVTAPTPITGGGSTTLAAPGGFSARPTGQTSIDVWWQAVTGAKDYVVWYRPYPYDGTWVTAGHTAGTNMSLTNLTKGTTYAITVRAEQSDGTLGDYPNTIFIPTTN